MAVTGDVQPIVAADERTGVPAIAAQSPGDAIALRRAKDISVAAAVALLGAAVAVFGGVMILARARFAAMFLGARTFLDVPLTDEDAAKVLFMAVSGVAIVGIGLITVAGGIVSAIVTAFRQRQ